MIVAIIGMAVGLANVVLDSLVIFTYGPDPASMVFLGMNAAGFAVWRRVYSIERRKRDGE